MDYLQYKDLHNQVLQPLPLVLNLIINGLLSILKMVGTIKEDAKVDVLNLIINGLPSIQLKVN